MTMKKYITPEILIHNIELAPLCQLSSEKNRGLGDRDSKVETSDIEMGGDDKGDGPGTARGFSFSWEED